MFLSSILMSILDLGVDVADAAVDAVSVGIGGIITSIIDIPVEIVLEILQIIIASITIYYFEGDEPHKYSKKFRISVIIILGIVDIVMSVLGFIPYFDIIETVVELITEIAQTVFLAS